MARTIYYTASSLDGFIATEDHSLEWLFAQTSEEGGPIRYDRFIAETGALAMGATTYEWILEHSDAAWGYAQPTWVFTHRDLPRVDGDVRFTQADVTAVHAEMTAAAGGKNVWLVGGGDLVGQFADQGLLDEIFVSFAAVTLGSGAPLLPRRLDLALTEVFRSGDFCCATYDVVH